MKIPLKPVINIKITHIFKQEGMILVKQIIPFRKEIEFKTMITKITGISLEHTLSLADEYTVSGDFVLTGTYKMTEASQIEEDFSYKVPVEVNIDDKYDTKDITLEIDDFTYEVVDEEKLSLKIDLAIDNLTEKQPEQLEQIDTFETFESISLNDEKIENELKDLEYARDDDIEDLFLATDEKEDLSIDNSILEKIEEENIKDNTIELVDHKEDPVIAKEELMIETPKPSINFDDISGGVESIFSAFSNTEETFSTYCVYIVRETDTIDSIITKYKTSRDILAEYNNLSEVKIGSKIIIPNYQDE